jgi:hypothetical protein
MISAQAARAWYMNSWDRDEALQVRLLVDREVDLVRRQQLLRDRREVVAPPLTPLSRSCV